MSNKDKTQPTAAELRSGTSRPADTNPASSPSTPNAKANAAADVVVIPGLSSLRNRANQALELTRSLLQEANDLSQHTGPAPAELGAQLREVSDTLNRVEKQAEGAKKFLRLAADLSKSRPKA